MSRSIDDVFTLHVTALDAAEPAMLDKAMYAADTVI